MTAIRDMPEELAALNATAEAPAIGTVVVTSCADRGWKFLHRFSGNAFDRRCAVHADTTHKYQFERWVRSIKKRQVWRGLVTELPP